MMTIYNIDYYMIYNTEEELFLAYMASGQVLHRAGSDHIQTFSTTRIDDITWLLDNRKINDPTLTNYSMDRTESTFILGHGRSNFIAVKCEECYGGVDLNEIVWVLDWCDTSYV